MLRAILSKAAKGVGVSENKMLPDTGKQPKPSKHRNIKCEFGGYTFDSKKEMDRYKDLYNLQRQGLITNLECQVRFELIPKSKGVRACAYIADFTYTDYYGNFIVCDVKPKCKKTGKYRLTTVFVIKQKLMLERWGIEIALY